MTVAAITTIAVALSLIGFFVLTFYQVSVATTRAVGDFEMQVFGKLTLTKAQLPALQARILRVPGVKTVRYISKEQAFADAAESMPGDIPNQFNETFVIKMSDARRAPKIAGQIRSWRDSVQEVAVPETEMSGVMKIAGFLRTLGAVGGSILLFGALIVVSNTVRISLFARRREIKIMQIVGATGWFIRLPLLIEGILQGLLGGLIAAVCLYFTAQYVNELMVEVTPMLAHYFQPVDMLLFGAATLVLGTLIGAFGSGLSIRRYLRAV